MAPKSTKVSDCWTIVGAARQLGVARTTIVSAIDSGYLVAVETADGHRLVPIAEARKWHRDRRPPGPRPAKKKKRS